ncbi:SMC family ATPase [Pseudanabaena galeata UHCC 0370]|uniref:Nuclease SbcCD subunit C n=1 Tax=Pseudanabaena galeata UHCC 0370 TaxID=3110310 RepID=A0ABU5TMK2_9CYAN|nr:SMC family ATPase [Pseudanabaena galeata]MEA5478783.1 SMC family ATPase [Pseudanabaena galeata UHCC 0370]
MRPLELIVEGFTSFRTRQVLDFTSLDLFAITGATGAGKTSLLDAMTFALYDEVSQKPSSPKELVSQGAKQLRVEFRFVMRQTEYKAVRTWRNRGKTAVPNFMLEELVGEEWERCSTQNAAEIIGMDFKTFTRVIILPQGQFDEFLKGEAGKRREILRQLAGFQIFEQMRKEASDRTSRFKAEREGLDKVLEGMQAPTKEEVESQQLELANLEIAIPDLDIQAKQSQKLLEAEERLFAQIQQYQQLSVKLAQLQQDASQIQVLENQLRNAQLANSIMGTWTVLQTARKRVETTIADLANTNKQLEIAKFDLDQQQQADAQSRTEQIAAQSHIEAQERNLALAESLHTQQQQSETELERANQNVLERSQVLKKATKAVTQAESDLQAITQNLQTLEVSLKSSQYDPARLEQLRQVAEPLTQWQILQNNLTKQQQKSTQLQTEIQSFTQQLEKAQQAIAKAEHDFRVASNVLKEAESSNLQALQTSHANALRAELHDGDHCPVCNHLYSLEGLPELPELELIDTTGLVKQKEVAERQLAKSLQDKAKIEASLESSQQQFEIQTQEISDLESQLAKLQKQIDQVLKTAWQAVDILRDRQVLEAQESGYLKLIAEQKEMAIALQNAENKLKTSQENLQLAQKEFDKSIQEKVLRESQLQEISQRLLEITNGKSYESLRQSILQAKTELSDRLKTIETKYQQARETFAKREESATKVQENHDLAIAEQNQQETYWQQELNSINFTELEFLAAQTARSQMDVWLQQIDNYQRQEQDLTTRLQMFAESISDRQTDEQAIAKLREKSLQAEQALQIASESRASIKAWLEQAQQKRQESQELEERKIALQVQEQTYHTLAQDLQSNRFQEYILDSLQQELAYRASALLQQLSEDRYILQIESGDYWVADNWNGGEKRRVKTLSGGETFAASLSMALALSERLSMGIELGSLFLDEGFGTLDSETLESVTQILESLRQQDRLIGVITHIQSLAERLPTQIHVRKSINGSELVRI